MLDKFRHKLPKEELKRLGKDIAKKLVASDYKNKRVEDPTATLSEKQTLKIKKFVKDFLTRAVEKYESHQKKQGSKGVQPEILDGGKAATTTSTPKGHEVDDTAEDIALSDAEDNDSPSSQERKRKREVGVADSAGATPTEGPDTKRLRAEDGTEPSPPPPPPPPPDFLSEAQTEEQKALQEQEEALMRENEEAQRLEDEANTTKDLEGKADEMRKDIALAA